MTHLRETWPLPGLSTQSGRRRVAGLLVSVAGIVALTFLMLALRSHLSIAIPALAFVVPVMLGVMVGGALAGVVGAAAGFLSYDYYFLPPFGTLTVRAPSNWAALGVYVLVVMVVSRIVTNLKTAREQAGRREQEAARLFELSRALIGDLALSQLLDHIVTSVQSAFSPRWTALLLPSDDGGRLAVAASAGEPLCPQDVDSLTTSTGEARSLGLLDGGAGRAAVALVASNRPVGMLVLNEVEFARQDRALLGTFANQAALAVERTQLREQALRSRLLEEIDVWRRSLMGAVSHDLRTPLASVKAAVSSLRQAAADLAPEDRAELLELIETQTDRLARLVTNLLDMTRIESGSLEIRRDTIAFDELVDEALDGLGGLISPERVDVSGPEDLPLLDIDHVLTGQVLVNLLENAVRVTPPDSVIRITARSPRVPGGQVEIAVSDDGPGIAPGERDRVFEMFSRSAGAGRAGLGLTIAKAFVEAHGGRIWVDPEVSQGARVVFTVPSTKGVPIVA
jgi:two-component system sensor histidine kinase KdpD